jgi:NRAMP (natural resistance-associated macrophage protein)-like metal ion transporter
MSLDQPPPHLPTDLPSPGSAVAPQEQERRSALLGAPRGRPTPLLQIRRWLRILGPGLVTGAADDDPSGIGTYSQAGAAYGTGQLWLALYMLPLLIAVQEMCARIGLVTGKGIAAVVRQHYSRSVLFVAVGLVLVANTLNIGADLGAMAATVQLLVPGIPFFILLVVLSLGILALEVFVPYQRYAIVLKVLALSLFAYVATGLIVGPRGGELLRATVVPNIEFTPAFLALVVGVLGTTISPYLFFWQASEEVEEVQLHHQESRGTDRVRQRQALLGNLRILRVDTILGMILSEIATWFIIFTTGSVLHTHGVTTITTADQAAAALEPLVHTFPHAGTLAKVIFAVGILGVGLLGIPVLAGSAAYAVAEAFHWKEGLAKTLRQAPGFYLVIGVATVVGLALNLLHINPIRALVYSAIINGVVAVPLLVLILLVANNRAIMKTYTNGRLANAVGAVTVLGMGAAAIAAVLLFIKG